jgi:hypothetical protein
MTTQPATRAPNEAIKALGAGISRSPIDGAGRAAAVALDRSV